MRKGLLIIAVMFGMNVVAQTEKQITKVTNSTCECLQDKGIESGDMNKLQMELGICMLAAMGENNISIDVNDPSEIESFGEKIGIQLAYSCPKFLEIIGEMVEEDPDMLNDIMDARDEPSMEISTGIVSEVKSDDFVTLKIKNISGKKETFFWMQHFEGSSLLENDGRAILQKNVYIEYETIEVYSPKLEDYIDLKIIRFLSIEE
ncbi:MAG: hypothetical protein HRT58_09155 [Crocinitomicaceae bacterium]|nr:hypothetical protein [Flavobacteriales bacterium]NQZ35820.1 hypothetical protein [Crocinitomicaceae bacterium]